MRFKATDFIPLYRPSECARRVSLRHRGVPEDDRDEPLREVLRDLGLRHEATHLATLPGIVDLTGPDLIEREQTTLAAIREGVPALYQARFRTEILLDGESIEIVGEPDYLLRRDGGYAIRDSKLSRKIGSKDHVEIQRQLQIYGFLYERVVGEPPRALEVHAGTGEIVLLEYEGAESLLGKLRDLRDKRLAPEDAYEPVGWSKCGDCGYRDRCWNAAEQARDISLLPGIHQKKARELYAQGVTSLDRLRPAFDDSATRAMFWEPATKKKPERLKDFAVTARRNLEAFETGLPVPIERANFPDPSACVLFDLEGLPPYLDELEKAYLWGFKDLRSAPAEFLTAQAGFGPDGDREGWDAFLELAERLLAKTPEPTFIHWGTYERTKIIRYIERFGDPNGIAARLCEKLFDLLNSLRKSYALPLPSYGLKVVEKLAGFERRLPDADGAWAMAKYIEASETEDPAARNAIVSKILAYNEEDLDATAAVLHWVRDLRPSSTEPVSHAEPLARAAEPGSQSL